ncbi:hypothetical protein [Clostridium saccharoperbutylacetonicum]
MSKDKKEKLILQSGSMSQSKVKSYVEREEFDNRRVSPGRDITINEKH